mmetsp:Transcript_18346/g.33587  ORF Transcript_18346/g.33587 Transcript_18346/m.33587 type:complete len:406 (-) Transcript_18346:184-1401(-)|eukprot:CAMPEP_0202016732 /NCGR_PEP_ID=MMETSP0905-20130828/35156_1 /ASSEMBLY_ACC=CAM_ASM_000554 /TAXON_ID=420261 /ORGANISM="Thalassiosira antarctica, Strain CCMP982" /LENGTH=405 /DNA_ID=CAMNT_0048577187 /DNA_START=16 /DNA_END=1233 /DNA_ORIENTATION=-
MADETPQKLNGDFLSGVAPGNDEGMASNDEREEEPNQRPLQLPRVGWGTDDDEDDTNIAQHPTDTQVSIPETKHDDIDGVVLRALSRNSEGELAPIPENMSMHGTWPDYYPDLLGCYDYDNDRKKHKYRRCGPNFTRRLCAVFLIAFAAVIGSTVTSNMAGKQPLPISPNSDSDAAPVNLGDPNSTHQPDLKYQHPPDVDLDLYQAIVDTFQPIMFDDSTQWDGTFFHAFEFCGAVYNRIPCPYIAYCPLGPGNAPLGGTKNNMNGSWAPIFDSHGRNDPKHPDWVQLGSDGTCDLYSNQYDHPPPWGNIARGDDATSISRHVMCCLESVDGTYRGEEARGPSSDPYFLDRPPSLEEDELEKPIPVREEEEGDSVEQSNNSDGNRILRSNTRERRKTKHNKRSSV